MAAPAPAPGKRKRDFSEDDAYLILHKYTPATILTALQEVARHTERRSRIDWKALVAKTATGITSAREYQMLWRYLAYRHDFVPDVDDDSAQPLDDESDLECEVEPFPTPSSQAAAEASGFAKILIYGSSREQASNNRVKSEVPALNNPYGKIPHITSDKQLAQSHRLTNGTGPVSNSKQEFHTGLPPDSFEGNGPPKKKKKPKPWSKEEDAHLTTGVHKCGEGNWLDIMHKYSFDNTRSALQLSQRWSLICKRQGTTKPGNAKPVSAKCDISATQNALSVAIGNPGLSTLRRSGQELKFAAHSSSLPLPAPVAVPMPVPLQVQMSLPPAQSAALRVSNTSNKSRINSKKQAAQINTTNAQSSIQAAAIAAGGRIATQSAATKLLKAAQSTKAVRVRSGGTHLGSAQLPSSKSSVMSGESGTQLGSAQLPAHPNCKSPNVVPEVAGINPQEQSASARLLETERRMSTTPVSVPCDDTEMDDGSTFRAVTMEDLFPEDVKQSDIVDPKADQEITDTKDADMLDQFDRFVESQKKQPKELPAVGKSIPVSARAPAAVKKAKTLGSTFPPEVTYNGLVGTGNDGVLSKALVKQPSNRGTTGKQDGCRDVMAQRQHATNSKGNVAPGNGTPARTVAPGAPGRKAALGSVTLAKNTAPATGPLAKNRQYNQLVSGASKGNPPPAGK